jgi:hypothetical protein
VGQRVSHKTVTPKVKVAATTPVITSTVLGLCWLGNTVNGTNADDPAMTAKVVRAERSIPRWRKKTVVES